MAGTRSPFQVMKLHFRISGLPRSHVKHWLAHNHTSSWYNPFPKPFLCIIWFKPHNYSVKQTECCYYFNFASKEIPGLLSLSPMFSFLNFCFQISYHRMIMKKEWGCGAQSNLNLIMRSQPSRRHIINTNINWFFLYNYNYCSCSRKQ